MFQPSFKLIFSRFLLVCSLTIVPIMTLNADIPNPLDVTPVTTTILPADKALQTRVLTLIETFSILLHKIGVRVSSLKLSSEMQNQLKSEFATMQEDLKAIKATHSLHVNRQKLEKLVVLLNALIKATEKALKKSFTIMPEPDPRDITRGQKSLDPEELEELLRSNEKRLRSFDQLIANMNKTIVNRSYSLVSDYWNTPIFSITSLGGESNKDIYVSSILKRMFTYSASLGLIVYNLPEKHITSIPNNRLRNWVYTLKGWMGQAPFTETTSRTESAFETTTQAEPKGWTLGDLDKVSTPDVLQRVKMAQDGMPLITDFNSNIPAQLTFNGTSLEFAGGQRINKDTKFKLHLESGSTVFTYSESASLLKELSYDGNLYIQNNTPVLLGLTANGKVSRPDRVLAIQADEQSYFDLAKFDIATLEQASKALQDGNLEQVRMILNKKGTATLSKDEFIAMNLKVLLGNGQGVIEEYAPGQFRDIITKRALILSEEALQNRVQIGRPELLRSDYKNVLGTCLPPELVRGKGTAKYGVALKSERQEEHVSADGVINKLFGNVRWFLHPELAKISFQIPIAGMLASQVYEDVATLKKDIPQFLAYWHNKMRGEEEELIGSYLVPKETFDDVVGREDLKNQLLPIINFVSNPASFIQAGIQVPRGYLLAGEPQTGKTLMVKALAGQLSKTIKETQGVGKDVKVFPIEVHYLIRNGIKFYMDLLRDQAPCILFCDEFDLTGAQRSENKTFLAEALTALSGYATSSDLQELVLFIIATNRPENIDYAILRDGRCGSQLYFENPYFKDRKDFFEHFFKARVIDPNSFDLDGIAQETEACSYGTLQTIAHGILSTADKYNKIPNQTHADEVLDTVVRKIIYEGDEVSQEKREILAARYGAKAFASVILNPDRKFVAVTISKITEKIEEKPVLHHYDVVNDKDITGIRFGGLFSYNRSDTYGLVSNEERIKECKVALAGTVGQRVVNLDYTSYPEDEMEALKVARRIVFDGCDERLYPRKVREKKGIEAYLLVEKCRQEMHDLLEQHRDSYEKLIDLLQRRKVIRTSDIKQCFGLDDLDLIEDYFSKLPTAEEKEKSSSTKTLAKELLEQNDDELDSIEEEEEELERQQKLTSQLGQAYQTRRRREFEEAEAQNALDEEQEEKNRI